MLFTNDNKIALLVLTSLILIVSSFALLPSFFFFLSQVSWNISPLFVVMTKRQFIIKFVSAKFHRQNNRTKPMMKKKTLPRLNRERITIDKILSGKPTAMRPVAASRVSRKGKRRKQSREETFGYEKRVSSKAGEKKFEAHRARSEYKKKNNIE